MRSCRPETGRRAVVVLAAAMALAGCSSDGGDWNELLTASLHYWNSDSDHVSIEEAAQIPFATLGIRIDGGPEQVLVLATDDDGVRLWTSSGHVSLETRDGRVIRTSGFGTDLSAHIASDNGVEDWLQPHAYAWVADFHDLGRYSVQMSCRVAPQGRDSIKILGKVLDTVRVDEHCESAGVNWNIENTYWVSPRTRRVWRSIQHFHPNGPEIEVEYLRPPEGDR